MTNSVATETLTCATPNCGTFTRDRKRGVKPKHCPTCTQRLADEAKAADQAEAKVQNLHCESCGKDWTRPAQRGKPPKRCSDCAPQKAATARPAPVSRVVNPQLAVAPTDEHYTVKRLLKARPATPVEEQYKFQYIESQLADASAPDDRIAALKRVWQNLEGQL